MSDTTNQLQKIRVLIVLFMGGLFLSGLTAFPIETQLNIAHDFIQQEQWSNGFTRWLENVYVGVHETNSRYPFISYGTDWLAFAHLVIAVVFIGPLRDPVRNIWVIQFGIIACIAIFPLALEIRGIPMFWRLIDCSFGVVGGFLLLRCHKITRRIELTLLRRVRA
jgi:hypothetical protein